MQSKTETRSIKGIGQYTRPIRREILEASIGHVNRTTPKARITLINIDDVAAFINEHKDDTSRYRLIVHYNGAHHTAVDINPAKRSGIVLDAARDDRGYETLAVLKKHLDTAYFASGLATNPEEYYSQLQRDTSSCAMFALDHCIHLTSAPDSIYQDFQRKIDELPNTEEYEEIKMVFETSSFVPWDVLPPEFLWNAQSMSKVIGPYERKMLETHPEILDEKRPALSFKEYLHLGLEHEVDDEGKDVARNRSIDKHVFAWAERIYHNTQEKYKTDISQAMQRAIDNTRGKGAVSNSKQRKLDRLSAIKTEFDQGADSFPTFCTSYIHRFENEAKIKRGPHLPNIFGREATSFSEFKKEMARIKEEEMEAQRSETAPEITHKGPQQ